jgi:uncharacterized protein (TIGR02996 family)
VSLEQSFLADILSNPGDDTPRLVYADWLTDHGDEPRAELIRVQCRAERLPPGDPERQKLEAQAKELLDAHLDEWVGPLKPHLGGLTPFARGFPRFVFFHSPSRFISKPVQAMVAEWFPRAGVMSVGISAPSGTADPGRFFPAVAACPAFACLHTLRLSRLRPGDAGLKLLGKSAQFANLRELEIIHPYCSGKGVRHLAESPHLLKLTSLTLDGVTCGPTPIYDSAAIAPLLDGEHLPHLRRLRLPNAAWSLDGAREQDFTTLPGLANLRCLDLWSNLIADEGAKNLAACEHLGNLTELVLARNQIRDEGTLALISSPGLHNLERLDLRDNRKLKPATLERLRERFGAALQY